MAYKIEPGGLRLPCVKTEEDVDNLSWLSDEEKKFAKENLKKIPLTDGWFMLGNDPYVQAFWQFIERFNTAIQNDKGQHQMQSTPFVYLNFCHTIVARRSKNEYMLGFLESATADACDNYGIESGYVKSTLIDYPDSAVWTDEQRLCIKFVNALYDHTMTDEIFQEAIDTWGEKQTIRNISWFTYVLGWGTLLSALNLKYIPQDAYHGVMTPENIAAITDSIQECEEQFANFWADICDFDDPATEQ